MMPEEIKRIVDLTFLCSIEAFHDDFEAAIREHDEGKTIRIANGIKQYSTEYLMLVEGKE